MLSISGLIDTIDGRITEAEREIAALQAAHAALGGTAPVGAAPSPTDKPRRQRAPQRPKPTVVVPAAKLELLLSDSEGLSTSVLAARASAERTQVLTLLRELEGAGKVRRSGERRTTLWHVYTDEDRIAERTAELEALSHAS